MSLRLAAVLLAVAPAFGVPLLLAIPGTGAGVFHRPARAGTAPGDPRAAAALPPGAEGVYRQLFTRVDQDGKPYRQEELEPPLAPGSKFLTDGESHEQALAALDDFLRGRSEKKMTPVQRAVLQHDLWAVLATTAGDTRAEIRVDEIRGRVLADNARFEDVGDADLGRPRPRRELQKRLVAAMRRLALSPRAIAALPDNLADAVTSGGFPTGFDPRRPGHAFLPADLAKADGAWVGVANGSAPGGLAAPLHTAFVKGRSVFTVRLRLPGGPEATQAYLKKAAAGDVAQFPEGTQTALVRRMLLIDDDPDGGGRTPLLSQAGARHGPPRRGDAGGVPPQPEGSARRPERRPAGGGARRDDPVLVPGSFRPPGAGPAGGAQAPGRRHICR